MLITAAYFLMDVDALKHFLLSVFVRECACGGEGVLLAANETTERNAYSDRNTCHVFFFVQPQYSPSIVVSTAFGIIIGPYAIGIFDPMSWSKFDTVTLEFTRIVIAVQVMAAGVSLPR